MIVCREFENEMKFPFLLPLLYDSQWINVVLAYEQLSGYLNTNAYGVICDHLWLVERLSIFLGREKTPNIFIEANTQYLR